MTAPDEAWSILDRAARVIADAPSAIESATSHAIALASRFHETAHRSDEVAQFGLLPLCLALLVLHENYRSSTEGSAFRVAYVLGRTAAVVAALLAYGKLCGLITGVAGAGHSWMASDDLLQGFNQTSGAVGEAWDKMSGMSDWPKFALILLVTFVLICATLFAYVSGLLLSLCQGALMAILVIAGKPCIVAALVPGVGVAKSWARALGQVAAWSTVAGIIRSLLGARNAEIHQLIAGAEVMPMLKASAQFIVVAVSMLSVPKIVGMIFSGAVTSASSGVLGGLGTAYFGAKAFARRDRETSRQTNQTTNRESTSSREEIGGGRRVHKVEVARPSDSWLSGQTVPVSRTSERHRKLESTGSRPSRTETLERDQDRTARTAPKSPGAPRVHDERDDDATEDLA